MKLAEKITAILVIAGVMLMFSIRPEGQTITLISLLILSSIYFIFGFLLFNQIRLRDVTKKEVFKNLTTISIVFAGITGIALSIICVGILFKLMSLPGSNEMLMFGVIIAFFISIGAILMRSKVRAVHILIRTVIIGTIGGVLFFISSLSIIKFQYRDHPAYVEAYTQYLENPKDDSLWEKQKLEYNRVWMTEEELKEYEQSQRD